MEMMTFNGVTSESLDIVIEHPPKYEYPEKDYEAVHIPGKNGDLLIDKGSYRNVSRAYEIAIGSRNGDFAEYANRISEWLHSGSGYARLEDTYEPDYYRMAAYREGNIVENILRHAGRVTVKFDCKPQRYLKSGEVLQKFDSSAVLKNPTGFEALPFIIVRGSGYGVFSIGAYVVEILEITDKMVIDSEVQDAYYGLTNLNNKVTMPNGFPKLVKGDNNISFSGGINSVEVIPNWWTL